MTETAAPYQAAGEETPASTDIVLKDRDGNPVTYYGIKAVRVMMADGSTKDFSSGTGDGGDGGANTEKPIRFYDPYGEVVYAYSRAEIQELEELPPGPGLGNLAFDRWTHTLDELKTTTYFADVGPTYKKGSTPVTVLIIETLKASTSVTVCLDMWDTSQKATIDWGDGGTSSLTGSSSSRNRTASHTYTTAKEYHITITATASIFNLGAQSSSNNVGVLNASVRNASTSTTTTAAPDSHLLSVLVGSYVYASMYPVCVGYLCGNQRLRFVSEYKASSRNGTSQRYFQCPSLKVIAGNSVPTISSSNFQTFYGATNLRRVRINGPVPAGIFTMCDSLEEVIFGIGVITDPTMNSKWAMLMTATTPPTINAASPMWGTHPIYVPDEAVDAYKAAAGWSTAADYILPQSQYPDE